LSEPGQETAVEEAEALELDKEVVVATDVDVDMELPEAPSCIGRGSQAALEVAGSSGETDVDTAGGLVANFDAFLEAADVFARHVTSTMVDSTLNGELAATGADVRGAIRSRAGDAGW
jgi:hypothetical protein